MAFDGFMPSAPMGDPAQARLFAPSSAAPPTEPTVVTLGVGDLLLGGISLDVGEALTVNLGVGDLALNGTSLSVLAATSVQLGVGDLALSGVALNFDAPPVVIIEGHVYFVGTDELIPVYDINDALITGVTFTDAETGYAVDPANLGFRLKDPSGAITVLTPLRVTTGEYEVLLTATQSGMWRFTWLGTNASEDGQFMVSSSLSD